MKSESYTPGHSSNATDFMAERTLESHGEFILPFLTPGVSVLDCGCGPGTITIGIARHVAPGPVVGVDAAASQLDHAKINSAVTGIGNVSFQATDCYTLPFEANRFDRIFSHALLEHLSDPVLALKELHRVLKPGGVIGICSPDWGGFVLAPPSAGLAAAVASYTSLQTHNGGDVNVGRKLGLHLSAAGFECCRMSARYETYSSLPTIGNYLAVQLNAAGEHDHAQVFREWANSDSGMFAQTWVAATGVKVED